MGSHEEIEEKLLIVVNTGIDRYRHIIEKEGLILEKQDKVNKYNIGTRKYASKIVIRIFDPAKQNEFITCAFVFLYFRGKPQTETEILDTIRLEFESVIDSIRNDNYKITYFDGKKAITECDGEIVESWFQRLIKSIFKRD